MDTLGTISSKPANVTETALRLEAFERLRYLGESGKSGLLTGVPGTGKTELLNQLARRLRRDGISVVQVSLSGVGGPEIPLQFATRFGLGLSFHATEIEIWARLQEYAESSQALDRPLAFLVDHLDRAKESVAMPLHRVMELFGRAAWIVSSRIPCLDRWQNLLRDRGAIRVDLKELQPREAAQIVSRELARHSPHLRMTPDGLAALQELSGGRIRQVKQLAELATLAAEAEGEIEVDEELVRGVLKEFAEIV